MGIRIWITGIIPVLSRIGVVVVFARIISVGVVDKVSGGDEGGVGVSVAPGGGVAVGVGDGPGVEVGIGVEEIIIVVGVGDGEGVLVIMGSVGVGELVGGGGVLVGCGEGVSSQVFPVQLNIQHCFSTPPINKYVSICSTPQDSCRQTSD